jgi:peptidoglycan hydrolase-like protein with peptidoglycan-binding domain
MAGNPPEPEAAGIGTTTVPDKPKVPRGGPQAWLLLLGGAIGILILVVAIMFAIEAATSDDREATPGSTTTTTAGPVSPDCRETLGKECQGQEVIQLEAQLQKAGFLAANPDAVFGDDTEAALYAFSACNGARPPHRTVQIGSAEWDTIMKGAPPAALGTIPCDSPQKIQELQGLLVSAGYGDLDVDGMFGPHTEAALRLFELDTGGGGVDGRIDSRSGEWLELKDAAAHPAGTGRSAQVNDECRSHDGVIVITYGCKSAAVEQLEGRLGALGFKHGSADSTFGDEGYYGLLSAEHCLGQIEGGTIEESSAEWVALMELKERPSTPVCQV